MKKVNAQNEDDDNDNEDEDEQPGLYRCISIQCEKNHTTEVYVGASDPGFRYQHYTTYDEQGTTGEYTEHYEGSASYGISAKAHYKVTKNKTGELVSGSNCVPGSTWDRCQPCDPCGLGDVNYHY